jgi:ATP adenylyltransferase/5',5'''-P-1,P-4-tetraphosphate phosphorylase II
MPVHIASARVTFRFCIGAPGFVKFLCTIALPCTITEAELRRLARKFEHVVNVKSLPFNLIVMTLEQIVRVPEDMHAIACYCETLHLRLPYAPRYRGSLSAREKSF